MKIEFEGMTIHVSDGKELEVVLDAVERRRREREILKEMAQDVSSDSAEGERVGDLLRHVNANARKFMFELLATPAGISGDDFSENTGIKQNRFGGIMGGIQKLAEHRRLSREQFIVSTQKTVGTERLRWLMPGPLLMQYQFELRKIMKDDGTKLISMGA